MQGTLRINGHCYPIDTQTWMAMLKDHLKQCRKREDNCVKYAATLARAQKTAKYAAKKNLVFGSLAQAMEDAAVDLDLSVIMSSSRDPETASSSPLPTESASSPLPTESASSLLPTETASSPLPTESAEPRARKEVSPDLANVSGSIDAKARIVRKPVALAKVGLAQTSRPMPRRDAAPVDTKRLDASLFVAAKLRLSPHDTIKAGELRDAYRAWTSERKLKGFCTSELAEFFVSLPGVQRTPRGYRGICFL